MNIELSIVVPSYNAEDCINRCVDSVLAQSFENFELLVIDDASLDETLSRLRCYDDIRLRVIPLKENSGSPAVPRNIGIREARGHYIAFLDSDDFWQPNKLLNQIKFMKDNNCQFSCTNYIVKDSDGAEHVRTVPAQAGLGDLLKLNTVGSSTVMISKKLISSFEFRHCRHEDFDMWLRILKYENSVYGLGENLTTYVKQKSSRSKLSLRNIFGFHALFKVHGPSGNVGAVIMMLRYLVGKASRKFGGSV